MGIREVLKQKMGIGVENTQEVRQKVVVEQKNSYEVAAVCDTSQEIEQSVGVGIGIGGDDDE